MSSSRRSIPEFHCVVDLETSIFRHHQPRRMVDPLIAFQIKQDDRSTLGVEIVTKVFI